MKKFFQTCFILVFASTTFAQNSNPSTSQDKPRVIILATGGTIAGSAANLSNANYEPAKITVNNLLTAVPQIHDYADVKGEQFLQISSQNISVKQWLELANRVNEIFVKNQADGVVITHGTDTLEETAYFLSLTVKSDKPVVLVGSMRPSNALSQDGNKNLLDAVMVAASTQSKGMGVVTALNEEVYAARDVTKTNTTNTSTFKSRNFGPIGLIYDGKVSYYYKSLRTPVHKFNVSGMTSLPIVDIIYGFVEAKPSSVITAQKDGAKGIVYVGMGNGNYNDSVGKALEDASKKGVIVCRTARTGGGRVTLNNEVDDNKLGFVVADDQNPQKARILLMLALTESQNFKVLQDYFMKY